MIKTTESFYVLCYLLELIIKNLANLGKFFHENPLFGQSHIFRLKFGKTLPIKTLALPQSAFQVQKSKLHTLAIFKTWLE